MHIPHDITRYGRRLATILAVVQLTACTTVITLGEPATRNKVYSGTARQLELQCAHATCLDAPFSFVLDTLLLPVTIPWTILNRFSEPAAAAPPAHAVERR